MRTLSRPCRPRRIPILWLCFVPAVSGLTMRGGDTLETIEIGENIRNIRSAHEGLDVIGMIDETACWMVLFVFPQSSYSFEIRQEWWWMDCWRLETLIRIVCVGIGFEFVSF